MEKPALCYLTARKNGWKAVSPTILLGTDTPYGGQPRRMVRWVSGGPAAGSGEALLARGAGVVMALAQASQVAWLKSQIGMIDDRLDVIDDIGSFDDAGVTAEYTQRVCLQVREA
jgi:hypothetical protein